jgi:hypothetical protein
MLLTRDMKVFIALLERQGVGYVMVGGLAIFNPQTLQLFNL